MKADEYADLKKRLAYLADQRNRDGKAPLTCAERVSMLNNLYDSSLFLLTQLVTAGIVKGTGALVLLLERARLEIFDLERTSAVQTNTTVELHFTEPEMDA